MIVYLDTSALLKLLIDEPGSDVMLAVADASPSAASSALTEIESRAALARMLAGRRLTRGRHRTVVGRFSDLWSDVATLAVDAEMVHRAVALAERHALRAYDAVHLASAMALGGGPNVAFACFDAELRDAAAAEGLTLTPPALA